MKTLKKNRRMVGLSQHELAKRTGIRVGRIAFAETGRRTLTATEIEKIQAAIARRAAEVVAAVANA